MLLSVGVLYIPTELLKTSASPTNIPELQLAHDKQEIPSKTVRISTPDKSIDVSIEPEGITQSTLPNPTKQPISEDKKEKKISDTPGKISISPQPGEKVAVGQKITLTLNIDGGSSQESATFVVDGSFFEVFGEPPYSIDYTVPETASGTLAVQIMTVTPDLDAEVYIINSYLQVEK